MWPETIKAISRDDADDMARAALGMEDLSDEVLATLWQYSQGSARVLNENLLPAIKDYGMGTVPLSAKLIETIAAKGAVHDQETRRGGAVMAAHRPNWIERRAEPFGGRVRHRPHHGPDRGGAGLAEPARHRSPQPL
ncbi:hypothetical protein [Polaromonas sp. UC242_47]|uniref:hypothetical protein n=1 Tax=Polaromonas sp. UC242_47 TaxID=3374626 RepID=UPI0037AAA38D